MIVYEHREWLIQVPDGLQELDVVGKLKQLGWEWCDAYDSDNHHPFRYGHYHTFDHSVVEATEKEFGNKTTTDIVGWIRDEVFD
ncbi:MAG: hypothetical protein M0R80_01880 [Proteobacteria bacterium]|jgi:hypothetical protein|nr:hypothetical protein [Pseudomonadota bacterium]